jgi:DNA-binding NarL/FixJ family response regulator
MKTEQYLRVVIADDQPLIRSGLEAFLMIYGEMRLVGEAQDGLEVLELCELVEPDVVLMDLYMPRMGGLEAARQISRRWPKIKVILLGDSKEPDVVQNALDAGAALYLTKDIAANDLSQAIHKLFQNLRPLRRAQPAEKKEPLPEKTDEKVTRSGVLPKLSQELAIAGKMQADLLPASPPQMHGWDFAARLEPARETSGDFFDFIPLANGNWGIVIADVSDKGMGAALFMALCSTLIRTYATHYPALPALAISTVNDRILNDSRGDTFVTVFFGVLEPDTGRLRYVNAGHNSPYLFSFKKSKPVESLVPTGMALGVMPDTHWEHKMIKFTPGDMLLLYTDGVTEAQDQEGRFFGQDRLLKIARALHGRSAVDVQDTVLTEINCFCGDASQADDIALMTIVKK